MKRSIYLILLLLSFQARSQSVQKIAVFAPLYIDSAFNDTAGYRFAKNVFPKYINPGLEFFEGVQLALDSLNRERSSLEVFVYDTRSAKQTLQQQLDKAVADSVGLILAHCTLSEIKILADKGQQSGIPVINVNIPNDGGVAGNPYYVIINPTLKTQVEGVYKYIQKYYPLDKLVLFRKKGQMEDRIKNYVEEASRNTHSVPLKIRWVELTDSFTVDQLQKYVDTLSNTVCIAGSLDENFGKRLVTNMALLSKQNYKATIIGMPTWDGFPLNKPEFRGVDVIYSNPFYNAKMDKVSIGIMNFFRESMFARPSDMVFRGYEVTWKFAKLLMRHHGDLASELSSKDFKVFTDFDIQPVLNKQSMSLDYFENKRLYFVKWHDGVVRMVNSE